MSRICELTGTRRMKVNSISIERSRVTARNREFSYPNLHKRQFNSEFMGPMTIRLSNRSLRTIEKKGGIDSYLIGVKSHHLTPEYAVIKKRLVKLANVSFTKPNKQNVVNARKLKKQNSKSI